VDDDGTAVAARTPDEAAEAAVGRGLEAGEAIDHSIALTTHRPSPAAGDGRFAVRARVLLSFGVPDSPSLRVGIEPVKKAIPKKGSRRANGRR
jgi:hypothetical protein